MKNWNIQKLLPLLKECGEIALNYYDNPPTEVKADKSIVTLADKTIEARLAEEFDRPEEGVYLIGEETVKTRSEKYIQNALKGTAWIVDPIDGTAPYSAHLPAWGISVAFMQNGEIKEGAIYLPPQNDCLITDGDKVLRCADVKNEAKLEDFNFKLRDLGPEGIVSISQKSAKNNTFSFSNQVFAWSGCIASFYYIFYGKLMAYVASLNIWDIAASLAIMKKSNVIAQSINGKMISTKLEKDIFDLESGSPSRWQLKEFAIIAPNEKIIDYIISNSDLRQY